MNMKIYKTQSEVDADIKNDALVIRGDVTFECDISLSASIIVSAGDISARNISARDISARDISAGDILARDISARNISAEDIKAGDILAGDISAWNIKAGDISAWNIKAGDISAEDIKAGDISAGKISAGDISYYAYCNSYESIKCTSIKGRREKHNPPVCLDGELIIILKGGK